MLTKQDLPPAGLATRAKLRGNTGAIALFGTIAALYFTRQIFIPFAFALILTFLLTPVVALLQRLHIAALSPFSHDWRGFDHGRWRNRLDHRQPVGGRRQSTPSLPPEHSRQD